MKLKNFKWQAVIETFLILMWVYAAMSKLFTFEEFKGQMHNQTLPAGVAQLLIYTLPEAELITAALLVFDKSKLAGLFISFILMLFFSGYIALVLLGYWERMPCSCGGILKVMGWKTHLAFNISILALISIAIKLIIEERRLGDN
ncbi:hypothetical protein IDJ75_11385 [Mucilaginibacter rigui]|uniref:Methylamine utilisation protein MauE domain-containing protein n=1 Tax=Mucilaginibacter rigui TaxID=534635 RepID=A0ABR7X5N9_9SPHI|nr:MauE/DoxX family redox-associated membrane protein [Mucilaginibacter rigui]MBD1385884.1 hypothetical protein [Mucilaginibacter rigui]